MTSKNERPEVYALRQNGTTWQLSRRDFLKAAGLGAAVMGVGMNSRFIKPAYAASDLTTLCKSAPAHQNTIIELMISADGKHLLSFDSASRQKCWDYASHALEKSEKAKDNNEELLAMASINGNSLALMGGSGSIRPLLLPELKEASGGSIKVNVVKTSSFNGLDSDTHGNIYGVTGNEIFRLNRTGDFSYSDQEKLYEISENNKFQDITVLSDGKYLFILRQKGFSIFDVQSGTIRDHVGTDAVSNAVYAVLPGGAKALVCAKGNVGYRLVSLTDGHVIWKKDLNQSILSAAVTPDGSYGILGGAEKEIVLISMEDGTVLHRLTTVAAKWIPIAVAKDGSSCAVAVDKTILFISLPDFELLGCPVDLKEMKDDTKGIKVEGTDPVTGRTVTYTLPCGSPIPEGAVCVCNCVAGEVCKCDGHVVCTCEGYSYCSCEGYSYCSCEGVGPHYWYPD